MTKFDCFFMPQTLLRCEYFAGWQILPMWFLGAHHLASSLGNIDWVIVIFDCSRSNRLKSWDQKKFCNFTSHFSWVTIAVEIYELHDVSVWRRENLGSMLGVPFCVDLLFWTCSVHWIYLDIGLLDVWFCLLAWLIQLIGIIFVKVEFIMYFAL